MWTIRNVSIRIKSRPFSPVIFCAFNAKYETASSSCFSEPPSHISDRSLTLKRFYFKAHGGQTQRSFIGKYCFSSQTKNSEEKDNEFEDGFSELDDTTDHVDQGKNMEHETDTEEEAVKYIDQGRQASSGLFNAIVDSPSKSVEKALDKWVEEGNDLSKSEISTAMLEFRKRKMYSKALQLSEWLEAQENVEFEARDYVSRVDLVAKVNGVPNAENYIKKKIPESFKGEAVYGALLANCVPNNNIKKAEQIFNEIKNLKLPITTFACEQLLLLYKRSDRRKMVDVLLLMEKENIKPSLFTYRHLIDTKAQSNDLDGMEKILEKMKGGGLKPDLKLQSLLARNYVKLGVVEKAKGVLKEMEGDNLNENPWVCSFLLPIYALLGSEDDVKRVWEICESDPRLHECLSAIDAFGKLKKVEEAEAVFDKMSKKWERLSAKHYTAMLKIYAYNKMWTKGKDVVKRMDESGCGIGPESLDALVKFYLEAGEIEKAGLILNAGPTRIKGKPWFVTYMMILDEFGKRGDVDNAEKIFDRMIQDGYVSRVKQYNSLLEAYINAKIPPYGFRKRLEADGIVPNTFMEARLAQVDAFKKKVSSLLDYQGNDHSKG